MLSEFITRISSTLYLCSNLFKPLRGWGCRCICAMKYPFRLACVSVCCLNCGC